MILVDLPGYGYARSENQGERLDEAGEELPARARDAPRICLLIDGRHGLKPNDIEIMDMLDKSAVPYQIVLTKMDKVKKADQAAVLEKTAASLKKHAAAHPEVAFTSAEDGTRGAGTASEPCDADRALTGCPPTCG